MPAWRNWLRTLLRGFQSQEESPVPSPPLLPAAPSMEDTSVPLSPLREWVLRQISPFAWDRAIIRLLSTHQELKLPLPELLKPTASTQIPSHLYTSLARIIREMYGIQVPQNLMAIQV